EFHQRPPAIDADPKSLPERRERDFVAVEFAGDGLDRFDGRDDQFDRLGDSVTYQEWQGSESSFVPHRQWQQAHAEDERLDVDRRSSEGSGGSVTQDVVRTETVPIFA